MFPKLKKRLKDRTIRQLKKLLELLGVRTVEREGVFVIIRHPENRDMILLVKHGYGTQKWSLPGGGIKQAEFAIDAAIREACDETGLTVEVNPNPIAHLSLEIKYGFTLLLEGRVTGGELRKSSGEEISDCRYFHKDDLPPMFNAQKGFIGWAEYHKDGDPVLYGHPNKPPIEKYRTEKQ